MPLLAYHDRVVAAGVVSVDGQRAVLTPHAALLKLRRFRATVRHFGNSLRSTRSPHFLHFAHRLLVTRVPKPHLGHMAPTWKRAAMNNSRPCFVARGCSRITLSASVVSVSGCTLAPRSVSLHGSPHLCFPLLRIAAHLT